MPRPEQIYLKPTSCIPNSPLPLLLYKKALTESSSASSTKTADAIEARFEKNGWNPQWRFGMFSQAHFHSTTHEALGVFAGRAICRFGVSDQNEAVSGHKLDLEAGDVLVIPAGVAHQAVESDGLQMVGAYPHNAPAKWDLCYGGRESDSVRSDIPLPQDPLGLGELEEIWSPA